MSGNNSQNNNNNRQRNNTASNWAVGIAAGVTGLALAAGAYYLASSKAESESNQNQREQAKKKEEARQRALARQRNIQEQETENNSMWNYFTDFLRSTGTRVTPHNPQVIVPDSPVITNLNGLLADIYVRYIALKDEDFEHYYNVFMRVFYRLHEQMKEADGYYQRYSSTVQFAGSHFDGLRINKPDEFDMDIIIGLPVNLRQDPFNPENSDVVLEPKSPGFVQLKMGAQFQNLPKRDAADWVINQIAYGWMDERHYLLRSRFIAWFKGVVNRAMNNFDRNGLGRHYLYIQGVAYSLRLSESGPAMTLIIENITTGFRLDVDLVPALKFPEVRWPICRGYRKVPSRCKKDIFMVVPKPNKSGRNQYDTDRSWRLALHLQERDLMHDSNHMRQAIRLIKKLRDSLGMDKIASYYIKTMFYLEAIERESDPGFWSRNNPATLFTIMVKKFHQHLTDGNIPYFWNKDNNLIGHIEKPTLTGYANKLKKLIPILENPSQYKWVAKYLLSETEFNDYNDRFLHI